ncbi:MAG: energy transducer TonB [Bacteroidetes bacterium]|nr:energy transducer TonB [Bacteroidota bacterium]
MEILQGHVYIETLAMQYRIWFYPLIALLVFFGSCQKTTVKNQVTVFPNVDTASDEGETFCDLGGWGMEVPFKGGRSAWLEFLRQNCRYPKTAIDSELQDTVRVRFTVEKDGAVSDVQALSGNEILQEEAIRVIGLSSGKWQPEEWLCGPIKSYHIQPFIFRLTD